MSAFLGPIHTWLYNKVKFQNKMVDTIITLAEEKNWLNESVNVNRYGELEQGDLAEICDVTNIHGWLQERVSLVENKLAYIVTVLTDENPERMIEINNAMFALGEQYAFGKDNDLGLINPFGGGKAFDEEKNAPSVFAYLEALLLNGMPCDRVNAVIEESEESVIWEQTTDIHSQYWNAVGGNIENFYAIRANLITGILEGAGFTFAAEENHRYEIRKQV